MVSSFSVSVSLNIPHDLLWRVRASKSFMRFLVSNGALNKMDATEAQYVDASETLRTRTQTYVPAEISIPEIVRPLFDDSHIEVRDIQTWDETAPYVQTFDIKPGIMADIVKSTGRLTLEAYGEKGTHCMQTIAGECDVGIPLLGWYVEQAIIANMKSFYKEYGRHVDSFVSMVVQKYGDGTRGSLRKGIDRLCADE